MSELANYSIETDQTVLLLFKDGRNLRVPVGQLASHLIDTDLERIRRAVRLRRDFLGRYMPKALLAVMLIALVSLLVTGGRVVAQLQHSASTNQSTPTRAQIARPLATPTPLASPLPVPAVQDAVTTRPSRPIAVRAKAVRRRSSLVHILPQLLHITPVSAPAPSPQPSPDPNLPDQPIAQLPPDQLPGGDPVPSPPPGGQVLGCSTGPDGSSSPDNCADDGSAATQP